MAPELAQLKQIPVLQELSSAELARLQGLLNPRSFPTRAVMLSMEQPSDVVHFLVKGTVTICRKRGYGANVIVNVCGPGEILGDIHAVLGSGHTANVICREPCQTLWMLNSGFRECRRTMPSLMENLLRLQMKRLVANTEHEDRLCTQDVPGRLAYQLLKLTHKFGIAEGAGVVLPLDPTQDELAEMIGTTRASARAALTSFAQKRYITRNSAHRITILNPVALASRSE